MGKKSDDRWVVPLCRPCHHDVHLHGTKKETEFFEFDPHALAQDLWDADGDVQKMKEAVIKRKLYL